MESLERILSALEEHKLNHPNNAGDKLNSIGIPIPNESEEIFEFWKSFTLRLYLRYFYSFIFFQMRSQLLPDLLASKYLDKLQIYAMPDEWN